MAGLPVAPQFIKHPMPTTTPKSRSTRSAFWKGFRDGLPFLFVVGPFALLFGVLAAEAGLKALEILIFSVVVIAGAAQFTALQLMTEEAPTVIILASALAVNLRMAMYSAALTPHLGAAPLWQRALVAYFVLDQSYACSSVQFEKEPDMRMPAKVAYLLGTCAPVVPVWYGCTVIGAVIGSRVPDSFALDFALPIAFLALTAPMMRTPAHLVAAFVSIVVSLFAAGLPFSLGVIVAGFIAMMAGAQTELYFERRKAAA